MAEQFDQIKETAQIDNYLTGKPRTAGRPGVATRAAPHRREAGRPALTGASAPRPLLGDGPLGRLGDGPSDYVTCTPEALSPRGGPSAGTRAGRAMPCRPGSTRAPSSAVLQVACNWTKSATMGQPLHVGLPSGGTISVRHQQP